MKEHYPQLDIVLNGGLKTIGQAKAASQTLNGVMFGRPPKPHPR